MDLIGKTIDTTALAEKCFAKVKLTFETLCLLCCPEINIAQRGKATQSSQHGSMSPDKAIDGNSNTNWNHQSCSSTLNNKSPWWRLDLLKTHKINTVTVTIRGDGHYFRINGAEIRIGNSLEDNGNLNPK